LGEEKCTPSEKSARTEKILATKGPPYVGMGPSNGYSGPICSRNTGSDSDK